MVPEPPASDVWNLSRYAFAAGLAGVIAGALVAGLGGRIFMRIAGAVGGPSAARRTTEAGFTVGEITLGGTIALVIFVGLIAGFVGAVMYLGFRPWLEWAGPWKGVVFGLLLFGLASATSDMMNPDNFDFRILGNQALLVVLIAMLFIAFGVVLDRLSSRFLTRLPGVTEAGNRAIYLALSIVGATLAMPLTAFILFSTDACSCPVPIGASVSFAVVFAAYVLIATTGLKKIPSWLA